MSADLPSWQPFDPSAGSSPAAITTLAVEGGDPRIIALLVLPGVDRRWAAETAVSIARAWDDTGESVLLSDLDLREPVLHEVLGHENGQGVSDVLLYGVSVEHASVATEPGSFLMASAGTPVADPEAVLAHPRWEAVTRGLRESGMSILLHLPSDMPGASSLLARADHVVVLADDESGAEGVDAAIAVLGPPVEEPAPIEEPAAAEEPVAVEEAKDTPEPTAAIDVTEEISDAVIEALAEGDDESVEEAVETGEVTAEEEPPPSVEDGFGDFALDEPEAPSEELDVGGDHFSFEGLEGDQYGHSEDASAEEEGPPAFDASDLDDLAGDDTTAEAPEAEVLLAPEPVTEPGEALFEVESPVPDEEPAGMDDSLDTDEPLAMDDAFEAIPPEGLETPSESAPMEGLESMGSFESMPVGDATDSSAPDDEEPPFDIDDGFEPGGDALDVERSSLADDVNPPADTSMMSGVEHGAGVEDELPAADMEPLVLDESPMPPAPELDDPGVVDTADEAMAMEPAPDEEPWAGGPGSDEAGGDEESLVIPEGPLQSQPERKMSGLDELERRRKWGERRRVFLTSVAALVILGASGYGLAFLGIVDVPGITPARRLSTAFLAPVQLDGPQPTTAIISHSLLINTYRTAETPQGVVSALRDRLPGMLFFYTPWEVDGGVQYAIFAGPGYSATQADSLREPLAPVLDRQNPEEWRVRATSYAFFLGEYDDPAGADARIEELSGVSIPAYVLYVDYADGRTAVRVYAGAFTDEFDAQPMAEAIAESGMSDIPLIERRGRLPE